MTATLPDDLEPARRFWDCPLFGDMAGSVSLDALSGWYGVDLWAEIRLLQMRQPGRFARDLQAGEMRVAAVRHNLLMDIPTVAFPAAIQADHRAAVGRRNLAERRACGLRCY